MTILCPAVSQGGFTGLSFGLGLVLAWQRGRHAKNSQLAQPHGDQCRVDQVNENPRHDGPPKGPIQICSLGCGLGTGAQIEIKNVGQSDIITGTTVWGIPMPSKILIAIP
jgi:hypothetical protein